MKRIVVIIFALVASTFFTPQAVAQYKSSGSDHVELGVFGEFFRVSQTDTNLAGLGARASFNVTPLIQLEAEASYDFDQVFTETDVTGVFIQRTNFRAVNGLFGPKLQTKVGPVRLFVTAKGGAVGFHFDPGPATIGEFTSTVGNLRSQNVNAVFYPGGGVEAFWGPIGLRVDIGDEIYFNNGARNNLRVTFGPTIRF
jgi:hypothetical protein